MFSSLHFTSNLQEESHGGVRPISRNHRQTNGLGLTIWGLDIEFGFDACGGRRAASKKGGMIMVLVGIRKKGAGKGLVLGQR